MNVLKSLLIALLAIFAPAKPMVMASFAFVAIDLVTGVLAARKRKEAITSSGFKRTLVKLAVYEVALLLAFLADQYLLIDVLPAAKIVSSFIGITELKSCLENVNQISGGDFLKAIIDRINLPADPPNDEE